jgi:hypothetical protein
MLFGETVAVYCTKRNTQIHSDGRMRSVTMLKQLLKIKLPICLTSLALRHEDVWGSECTDPHFFTSELVGGEWSNSRPGRVTPGERSPGTHWIGDWVDPRAGLDDMEKRKLLTSPGLKHRLLGRPARSQSLYRLSYPGSPKQVLHSLILFFAFCYVKTSRYWDRRYNEEVN